MALQPGGRELGLGVPDAALRQAVFDVPDFHGQNGQFDRTQFDSVLRNNGLTEARFLDLMRDDLMQRQLMQSARAGIASPDILAREVFAFQQEKRVADAVELPFAAAPPPGRPPRRPRSAGTRTTRGLYSTPGIPPHQGGRAGPRDRGQGTSRSATTS